MERHTLTELQYSGDRKGPFKLYIYEPNRTYHLGGVWFRNKPKYPGEEIPTSHAKIKALAAIAEGREVRVCDGGDNIVFHAKGDKVLYPAPPADFWREIEQA